MRGNRSLNKMSIRSERFLLSLPTHGSFCVPIKIGSQCGNYYENFPGLTNSCAFSQRNETFRNVRQQSLIQLLLQKLALDFIHHPFITFQCVQAFISTSGSLRSRVRRKTHLVVMMMCTMSQCKLRALHANSGMCNVICIETQYTLPPNGSFALSTLDCNIWRFRGKGLCGTQKL